MRGNKRVASASDPETESFWNKGKERRPDIDCFLSEHCHYTCIWKATRPLTRSVKSSIMPQKVAQIMVVYCFFVFFSANSYQLSDKAML